MLKLILILQALIGSLVLTDYSDCRGLDESSENDIVAACRDSLGFVWAHSDKALFRFDGNTFVQMDDDVNSLLPQESSVYGMRMVDSYTIIFTSRSGLHLFDTRTREVRHLQSLSDLNVSMVLDHPYMPEKVFLVATPTGLYAVDIVKDSCRQIYSTVLLNRSPVITRDNKVILNSGSRIVMVEFDKSFNLVSETVIATGLNHVKLYLDKFDNLFAYSRTDFYSVNLQNLIDGSASFAKRNLEVTAIGELDNSLLVCQRGKGCEVMYRDVKGEVLATEMIPLSHDMNYLSNFVNRISPDKENNCVWLCSRDGLYALSSKREGGFFSHLKNDIDDPQSLSHNTVNDILFAEDGSLWVATAYGLDRVRFLPDGRKTVECFLANRENGSILDDKMEQLEMGPDGQLWIGTKGGMLFANPVDGKISHRKEFDAAFEGCAFVRALSRDINGNMWIGFETGGVYRYDSTHKIIEKVDLPRGRCNSILPDLQGNIWITLYERGVFCLPQGKTSVMKEYHLSNARPLYVDSYNDIWCGSTNGLYKLDFKEQAFLPVELAFPSSDKEVVAITNDKFGNLWVAGLNGLCVYSISEQKSSYIIPEYSRLSKQDYIFEFAKNNEGLIFMSGIHGLTWFNPAEKMGAEKNVNCHFADFKINGRNPHIGSEELSEDVNYSERLRLRHSDNNISFLPSSFNYFGTCPIQYACKLDGINSDWVYLGTKPGMVSYSNIPTGSHNLSIRCTNRNGEWQEPHVLTLSVAPPQMLRWYFLLLYLALAVFGSFVVAQTMKMKRTLFTQKAINETSLKFYSEMVENMKNPFTLLKAPLQRLIEEKEDLSEKDIRYLLDTAWKGSDSMELLLEQLSERCELDRGAKSLELSFVDLGQFMSGICLSFKAPFMSKGVLTSGCVCQQNLPFAPVDKSKMENVFFEILSFIYRNAVSGSRLSVDCTTVESGEIKISMRCDGVHLTPKAIDSFFDTGLGLPLARDIVRLHKGTIRISSSKDSGLDVSVFLPAPSRSESLYVNLGTSGPDHSRQLDEHIENIVAVHSEIPAAPAGAPSIYLVMKEEQLRSFLANTLASMAKISQFDSPDSALEAAERNHPDLIISGLLFSRERMGLEFCKKVKASSSLSFVPFVIMSSISDEATQNAAYDAGADAFVSKPYTTSSLVARISNLLSAKANIISRAKREVIATPAEVNLLSADEQFLADAMKIMEKNIANEEFSVVDFSYGMNLSPSMLYRKIKSLTGMSPNEFIKDVRMKRAAQLLQTNAFQVSGVAYEVGFSDVHYFSTCFRRAFGMTPSEYKQKNGR